MLSDIFNSRREVALPARMLGFQEEVPLRDG
jgi:hypothetical protein